MNSVGKYLGALMQSRTQAHIFHLQTKSYAQHKALQEYYEEIVDLIDNYAECYQGKYGVIGGYDMSASIIEDPARVVQYFNGLHVFLNGISEHLPDDSYLRNVEDEISTLVVKINYLLTLS